MKIAEYTQIDTESIEVQIPICDDGGEETGEFKTITEERPVMGLVTREATPEEIAAEASHKDLMREPTSEERLAVLEDALAEMMEVLLDG